MSDEIWKDVVGYEGVYEVSSWGRVRRMGKDRGATPGRILALFKVRGAPQGLHLFQNSVGEAATICRLVLEAFVGPRPKGMECRHLNGNTADNRLENLAWGTRTENLRDRAVHEVVRGRVHGNAKLTAADVHEIRRLLAAGWKHKDIAKTFGVARRTITNIPNGLTWAWLKSLDDDDKTNTNNPTA